MSGYGSGGLIGIGTPQANPTVEAELAILLPRDCVIVTTRLTSPLPDSAGRLVEYIEHLPHTLASYDTLRPDVFGFACTGSSYLVGTEREAALVSAAAQAWGRPIVTACRAIEWALSRINARRIALVSPYPADLEAAALAWWLAAGFDIAAVEHVDTGQSDTRGIYALDGDAARGAIARADVTGVDAILVSGTGMPSLAAIADTTSGPLVLSSNLALAGRLLDLASPRRMPNDAIAPAGWRARLAEALSVRNPSAAESMAGSAP